VFTSGACFKKIVTSPLVFLMLILSSASGASEENSCPVCLNPLLCQVTTGCGHTFDRYCLQKWFIANKNCPSCRGVVTGKNTPRLYGESLQLDPLQTDLNCGSYAGKNISFDSLATTVVQHSHLRFLRVTGQCFKNGDADKLTALLRVKIPVQHLDLGSLFLTTEGRNTVIRGLAENVSLKSLSLSHNRLSDEDAFDLADSLGENMVIESIDLSLNKIGEKGAERILSALITRKKAVEIDLRWNYLEEDETDELKVLLRNAPWVKVNWENQAPLRESLKYLQENSERILNGSLKSGDYDMVRFTLRLKQILQKCKKIWKKNDKDLIRGQETLVRLMKKNDGHCLKKQL